MIHVFRIFRIFLYQIDCFAVKRALFRPAERNTDAKIEARFQWVTELLKTGIDYMTNCVFIDELGFNINMKRSMAWAPVGETPIVEIPKTSRSCLKFEEEKRARWSYKKKRKKRRGKVGR
ncbi:unnamed protein product [Mucor hiemalis]